MRLDIRPVLAALLVAGSLCPPALATGKAAPDFSGDGGLPAFYTWTAAIPARPGVMLRAEPAPDEVSLPSAGRAERILYSSTDWQDARQPIVVSGIVFLPRGKAPAGGWPVIAWAHGTTGIADVCAPSALPRSRRDARFLDHWLQLGYAIVASDYQGLGEPGVHPYINYRSEGISVLDAIRASLSAYPELSRAKIVTMGQSQGSEGAIAAAWLAPRYAPELAIKGTVATGLVAHTRAVGNSHQLPPPALYADPSDYGNSASETLWFLGTAGAAHPAPRPADYLAPGGLALAEAAQHACLHGITTVAQARQVSFARFYKRPIDDLDKRVTAATDFPDVRLPTPVFTGTGLADHAAQPSKQYNFIAAMCAAGTRVEAHYYPGQSHSSAVAASLADAPAFVAAAMAGKTIAGNCSTLAVPGPMQQPASGIDD